MNPPSALQGAMGRERKPFTYTPGGLDLSEIKSERMAKRLMRNAMNQGVPELPPQVQSPSTPTTSIAVPNFNCLPVQVFPTINLPANPKSLLRTRSTPEKPRESLKPNVPIQQDFSNNQTNNYKSTGMEHLRDKINNNSPYANSNTFSSRPLPTFEYNNNNRPNSMYEFSTPPVPNLARTTYGSDSYTAPVLPEISYDAELCTTAPKIYSGLESVNQYTPISNYPESITECEHNANELISTSNQNEFSVKPFSDPMNIDVPINVESNSIEDVEASFEDDDQTVKVVKKQIKKKVESEAHQNGDHNGDSEAELVVKLPTKKAAAKTETKVEVVKKTLPDGSTEETKTTTTKTTVDGKTSIATKVETTIIPKEEDEYEEVEEEEVEEVDTAVVEADENGKVEEETTTITVKKSQESPEVKESVVKTEESSETTTTQKVVITQSKPEDTEEEEEEEEVVEEEEEEEEIVETPTVVVVKKQEVKQETKEKAEVIEEKKDDVDVKEEVAEIVTVKLEPEKTEESQPAPDVVEDEEEKFEEAEEKPQPPSEKQPEPVKESKEDSEESEYTEEEIDEVEEPVKETPVSVSTTAPVVAASISVPAAPTESSPAPTSAVSTTTAAPVVTTSTSSSEPSTEVTSSPAAIPTITSATATVQVPLAPKSESGKDEVKLHDEDKLEDNDKSQTPQPDPSACKSEIPATQAGPKIPLREPSIPLEKVEEVEIKPIGAASETISKTHTERTEIISSSGENTAGTLSTQTEYNKIENIVTVNKTTKTLDHSYEQITQQGIPTVKTYFPPGRERVSTSPQPSRPYQPIYTPAAPQSQTERRHSLLLERLSTERQMPSDIYQQQKNYQQQFNNQSYEQQRQWSQEPQSEVVNDSNVKPSTITNQQWYQQSRKENVIFNNVSPSTPAVPYQQWSQPQPQPQLPPQSHPQPQFQTQFQPSYSENILHDSSKISSNTYQQTGYPSYTPAPSNWAGNNVGSTLSSVNAQSNQYSSLNQTSSESYQNISSTQQFSSSYVPPPWEQDPSYVAPQLELKSQNVYQQPPSTNTFNPNTTPGWKPTPPAGKFTKPVSKSYIPPAPNQSFVKTSSNVAPSPKRPGSKTYYSEYERRYITVPESTYIPSDAKFQAQPDPSPQYFYDNNEPSETVEHQWRKELREFTEKTQTCVETQAQSQIQTQNQHQQLYEQTTVIPPWEEDPKYAKVPTVSYTPTSSWSQTLRPQSNRERSFESEYINSNEWSKTNTLGRGRPLSSYNNPPAETAIPERARGVSVDRYNPSKYQAPLTIPYDSEHSPVQAHTLDPTPSPHRGYHNPNVPAYHARASAEPREHPSSIPTARNWVTSRATPIQSRSFKYLQWITGTED